MSAPAAIIPGGWLALTLLGWGYCADALPGAFVMAALVEALRHGRTRWALTARDFQRAADLTSVVFALAAFVQFQRHAMHGIYGLLRITPYCLFPLLLAQLGSTAQRVPMSALFYSLRRRPTADRPLDLVPAYVAVCLVAASGTAVPPTHYLLFVATVIGGVLVMIRPRRYAWPYWVAGLTVAMLFGLTAHGLLLTTRTQLATSMQYWFEQFPWRGHDARREVTSIGHIGRLKLSDEIRVRVRPTPALRLPLTLEEARYDTFRFGTWSATDARHEALDRLRGSAAWHLAPGTAPDADRTTEITVQHRHELTLLPLPDGAARVRSIEIAELQRNRLGAVMAEAPPGALRFEVDWQAANHAADAPVPADRKVPSAYATLLHEILAEIGVAGQTPTVVATRIRDFFHEQFRYSLVQRGSFPGRTPLAHFLTRERHGHCEYFATATVLLLRAAGIPARYAVGYVVDEYSPLERAYVARARHAHAWAVAYLGGRWLPLDTTPATWLDDEAARVSRWQTVQDLIAWLRYRYQRLMQADWRDVGTQLVWLLPPLVYLLYRRLRRSTAAVTVPRARVPRSTATHRFEPLLARLAAIGLVPAPGETLASFLAGAAPPSEQAAWRALVTRYYATRFSTAPARDASLDAAIAAAASRLGAG